MWNKVKLGKKLKTAILTRFWRFPPIYFRGVRWCHVHGVIQPPPGTFGCAKKVPRCHQNCSKGSFFGLNFCLRSKFEGIFKKSQIFFRFRADFRKKVCKKRGKKGGQNRVFWHLGLFYPILPYFPYFTLFRALFPMKRANAAAQRPTYSDVKG